MALAVASVIGCMAMTPAFADHDDRGAHHDNGRHRGPPVHVDRDRRDYRPEYRQPYYAQPVYVPPPVYYAPRQSPGISFFLPLDLDRR